ncbi:MAG TPA: hypothetical protein VKV39_03015 [Candidatus Sulfotelmatobacter sp.]|nr:hypothetical protein [Candidatus Sulfotelmatobacter sp.]
MKNFWGFTRVAVISLCILCVGFGLLPVLGQSMPPELFGGLKYRMIGPFRGGRVVAVAGIPGNATTFFFGSVDGGVWKTTDAGTVWTPIFDSQHVGSIGALAIAPSDPKVIYAGTGESDIRSDLASGDGVYVSQDGGENWKNVGLRDSRQISRIVIDPHDANVVYVGALGHAYGPNAERGVYKSSDGGAHWKQVLDQGPEVGVADLAISTGKPNLLFASTWHARRPPWSAYGPIEGSGSGLFRSQDSGETWSRLTGSGLPDGDWGRVGLAVAADGMRVYAIIDNGKKSGLYRSDDGGDHWTLQNSDPRLAGRGWYFGSITIDPKNADVFYVPNVALYRSQDGGRTISIVRGAPGGDDYHQIWVDPADSTRMVLGTDQGATVSLNYGQTWSTWYNQPTAQLYHVSTDNRVPYVVYGEQQDSGSVGVLSRADHGQITARDWFEASGSESGYIAPDPKDPDILYVSETYGGVSRFDRRTSFSQDITPWPVPTWGVEINERKYRDPWTPVLLFSPIDKKSLYLGTQYVMKTTDGGLNWQKISPDLTGAQAGLHEEGPATVENAKGRGYGVVFTIAPSALDAGLIWAGSDTGLIHVTRDGGKSWKDVTPHGLGDWARISLIEASHFDPAEAFAAVDRHRLDDQSPHVYRTRDFGQTWQSISDGIHAPSFVYAVREDPKQKGLLFAATEFGVYVSFDDGDHWQSLQLNLPVTSVRDLAIHGDDLVVATHGRSFWILDDISPLRQASAVKQSDFWLYRPPDAIRVDNDGFLGTPLPPEEPTGQNPPDGAILDYFLRQPAQHVELEILDDKRTVVRKFSSDDKVNSQHPAMAIAERWFPIEQVMRKSSGMHRFVWNLNWAGGDESLSENEFAPPRGPRAVPGTYQVRFTVDGKTSAQPLRVVMDPRSTATAEELRQQFELGRKIFEDVLQSHKVLSEIGSVRKRISTLESKLAEHPELKASLAEADGKAKAVMEGEKEPQHLTGLLHADNGLASALRVVESSDRAVPAQALDVYDEASKAFLQGREQWKVLQTQLKLIDSKLRALGLEPSLAPQSDE